jgi:hypothetical protein
LSVSRGDLRAGLGLGSRTRDSEREYVVHETDAAGRMDGDERQAIIQARIQERRFMENVRAAGL